jgi:hypothetical protein
MNYISSHFFKRKLEMLRDLELIDKFEKERQTGEQLNETLKITIRQYQELKAMEIRSQLIAYINQFCHENVQDMPVKIRALLRGFRFVFRVIYESLLEEIIQVANAKLLDLLREFPEILPYSSSDSEYPTYMPAGFYEGVWSEITKQEWAESLYPASLSTVDTHELVHEQLVKSINFKRLFLSQHDMVTKSVQQIKSNYFSIKSPHIFYFFI